MIVKIDRNEIEALKKVCALADVKCLIYTIEPNDLMVQAEIRERDGRELPIKDAWYIASSFRLEVELNALKAIH